MVAGGVLVIEGAVAFNGDKEYYDVFIEGGYMYLCLKGGIVAWRHRRYPDVVDKALFHIQRRRGRYVKCYKYELCSDVRGVVVKRISDERYAIILSLQHGSLFLYIPLTKYNDAKRLVSAYKKICGRYRSTQPWRGSSGR